jgi:branched-chain amino acid transport system substrate-binding protein
MAATRFSRGSAAAMRAGIADIGGTIVAEVDVSQRTAQSALPELRAAAPDAFLVTPLVDQSAAVVDVIRGAGLDAVLIGGNSFNTLAITGAAGDAIEGTYVGAAWNPAVDTAASERFVEAYTEKYGMAPDLFAAQGYSSVYVLLDSLKRAGTTDSPALRDALVEASDVDTPLGSLTFSDNREAQHEPVVQRFEDGKLVVLD